MFYSDQAQSDHIKRLILYLDFANFYYELFLN